MDDLDKMARELLAAEWRKLPEYAGAADDLESGCELPPVVGMAVDAIRAALLTAPPGYVLVPVEPTDAQLMWMGGHDEASQRRAYAGLLDGQADVRSSSELCSEVVSKG